MRSFLKDNLMLITPKLILQMIQLRRNLKGTVTTATVALQDIEAALAGFTPKCRACFFERGLADECRCSKNTGVD